MRIASVETFPISLPLLKPVKMSQITITESHNVLVKITTDEGVVGWGEGVPSMDLTGENQGRIQAGIDDLGSRIVGESPLNPVDIWESFTRAVYGNTTSIGAIDIALHDIVGKVEGVAVSELLGGARRPEIPALTLVGSGDTAADLAAYKEKYSDGYRWFKLKLGIGRLEDEAETITQMAASHDDTVVCGDTNGGWSEADALRFLQLVEGSAVRFVEQPTMAVDGLARLAEQTSVAICADESARSHEAIEAIGQTAISGVSLKLIKHAGITGLMRGAEICDRHSLQINVAGKIAESAIAAAANMHAASAMSDTAYGCSPGNLGVASDIAEEPPRSVSGLIAIPVGPGLGVDVSEDLLAKLMT